MNYKTIDLDLTTDNTSVCCLIEAMLQDAFLTNYKIMLGIVNEVVPLEEGETSKQQYVLCRPAIMQQQYVQEDGMPVFREYPQTLAKLIQLGNNNQSFSTPVISGQLCLLLFADRPYQNVWEADEIAPSSLTAYRAHDMNDSFCIPLANNVPIPEITTIDDSIIITGDTTIRGNLIVNGNVTVDGNVTVSGNIVGSHIEAEDGFTGTKTGEGISVTFEKGICVG